MSATYPVHHITLTVNDIKANTEWFQNVFGPADIVEREYEDFSRTRMTWPNMDDLRIAVMSHKAADKSNKFNHLNPGLDHLGFECKSAEEVTNWQMKLDGLGYSHGPVEDVPYATYITARTPDGIAVEFYFPK
jgi:catechol 2,3-dioxygenase-like lactoylglutathione lyase family enzyme